MKTKEFNNIMSMVVNSQEKIDILSKQRDNLLLKATALFSKGQEITFADKEGNKQQGKVLYNVGQKSLTIVTKANTKVNVNLAQIILT